MTESLLRVLQEKYASGSLRPNELDHSGVTLIHQAASDGQLTCLKWLLKHDGDINVKTSDGSVPAHYAAAGGHLQILQFIYDKDKTSITKQNDSGAIPLYLAAQEGQLDCLIWLIKTSSSASNIQTKDGRTAVHVAAQEGKLECLRYLLKSTNNKAGDKDFYGATPLHYASAEGHWKVSKWLVEHGGGISGCEQDNSGFTALHSAAKAGHDKVVETLVNCGVSPELKEKNGQTALDLARKHNKKLCASILKELTQDLSFDSQEKRVRFNERVFTYDNTSIRSRTSVRSNTFSRKGKRESMFDLDDDLQSQLDLWSNSPKIKRKRERKKKRNFIKERSSNLSIDNYKEVKNTNILVDRTNTTLNDNVTTFSDTRENFIFPSATFVSTEYNVAINSPPQVPERSGVPKLPPQSPRVKSPPDSLRVKLPPASPKVKVLPRSSPSRKNELFNKTAESTHKKYKAPDPPVQRDQPKVSNTSSTLSEQKSMDNLRSPQRTSSRISISSNMSKQYKSPRELPEWDDSSLTSIQKSPSIIVSPAIHHGQAKDSPRTMIEDSRKSNQQDANDSLSGGSRGEFSPREPPDGESQVGSPTTPNGIQKFLIEIPPTVPQRQNGVNKQIIMQNKLLNANETNGKSFISSPILISPSKIKTVSPMLNPRYKDMVANLNINKDDRPSYDATQYKPTSYLEKRSSTQRRRSAKYDNNNKEYSSPFTKNIWDLDMNVSAQHDKVDFFSNNMNRTTFTKGSTWSTIRSGLSSFFNTLRPKKLQDSGTWSAGTFRSPRDDIFTRFSIPNKASRSEFDDLFNTSVVGHYKPFNVNRTLITTPKTNKESSMALTGVRKTVLEKKNSESSKFKTRSLDNSLKGRSNFVSDLDKQHSPSYATAQLKKPKERVNAFIW